MKIYFLKMFIKLINILVAIILIKETESYTRGYFDSNNQAGQGFYDNNNPSPIANYASKGGSKGRSSKKSSRQGDITSRAVEPTCLANEEYVKCVDECGRHCRDITNIPPGIKCPKGLPCDKYSDGCTCKKEFYRKDITGECVAKAECSQSPKTARKAAAKKPDKARKAENKKSRKNKETNGKSKRKAKGLPKSQSRMLSGQGQCFGHFEVFSTCGSDCNQTCEQLKQKSNCKPLCKEGCFCFNGFYRNAKNICVNKNEC